MFNRENIPFKYTQYLDDTDHIQGYSRTCKFKWFQIVSCFPTTWYYLRCYYNVRIPYQSTCYIVRDPIHFPPNGLGKVVQEDPNACVPANHVGDLDSTPGFALAQDWPLQREWTTEWTISLSFSLCNFNFQINKYILKTEQNKITLLAIVLLSKLAASAPRDAGGGGLGPVAFATCVWSSAPLASAWTFSHVESEPANRRSVPLCSLSSFLSLFLSLFPFLPPSLSLYLSLKECMNLCVCMCAHVCVTTFFK